MSSSCTVLTEVAIQAFTGPLTFGRAALKVAGLQDALAEQGVDAGAILEKVEAEYGFGEDDEDVRDEDLQ